MDVAMTDSSKNPRYSLAALALPLLVLRRVCSPTLVGICFSIDYVLQVLLLIQIGYTSNQTGLLIISIENIPQFFWLWYLCHWIFVCLTWAYGYIGLSPKTPRRHMYAAIVRFGFCSASVGYLVLARIYVLEYWLVSFYIGFAWLLSVSHLYGAIQRLRRHWRQQRDGTINPRNKFINLMTGSKMRYYSDEERD